jgi:hypothetical protein
LRECGFDHEGECRWERPPVVFDCPVKCNRVLAFQFNYGGFGSCRLVEAHDGPCQILDPMSGDVILSDGTVVDHVPRRALGIARFPQTMGWYP